MAPHLILTMANESHLLFLQLFLLAHKWQKILGIPEVFASSSEILPRTVQDVPASSSPRRPLDFPPSFSTQSPCGCHIKTLMIACLMDLDGGRQHIRYLLCLKMQIFQQCPGDVCHVPAEASTRSTTCARTSSWCTTSWSQQELHQYIRAHREVQVK